MKTKKSNLNETTVKSSHAFTTALAAAIILLISVFAVNANSEFSNLENLLAEEKDAESFVEEWMINTNNFYFEYTLEEATETKLEVETWMLEDSLFNKKDKTKAKEKTKSENESNVLAEVKTGTNKKAVGVTNSKTQFGRRAMILVEDEDPKLKMEQWMLDYRHWNLK